MAIKKIKDSNGVEHELQTTIANVDGLQEELNKRTDSKLYQYYTLTESDAEYPIIYSYTTDTGTTSYKSTYGAVKSGFTFNPYTNTLNIGNINLAGTVTVATGDNWVDFMFSGGDAGIYFANDENENPTVELYGNVTVNGEPIGSGGGVIGDVLEVGTIKIDGETNKLENIDSPNNNIYIGDDTVDIEGMELYLRGDTYIAAQGHIDLSAGQETGTYITLSTVDADDRRIDISSDKIYLSANNETIIWGTNNVGIYTGDNDNAYIDVSTNADSGVGLVDINAEITTFYGSTIAFNSLQIGKYEGDVDNIDFMFNGGDAGMLMSYDPDGNSIVDIYGDKVTINGKNPIGSGGGFGKRQVTFDELKEFLLSAPVGQQVQVVCLLEEEGYEAFTELGACLALNTLGRLSASKLTTSYEDEYPRLVMDEYRININKFGSDDYATLTRRYIPFDGGYYDPETIFEESIGDGSFEFYILGGDGSYTAWPEEEKEAIVNDMVARLPVYNGEEL